jgi:hypothetical protein
MKAVVKARLVDSAVLHAEKRPGDFEFYHHGGRSPDDRPDGIHFWCPCGCGEMLGAGRFNDGGWQWDGNREAPTLTPSILHMDGCRWHGFLTKGEFLTC